MGATVQTLILEGPGGETEMLSLYFAGADAAGYRVSASAYLAAVAGSPTEWTIPGPRKIKYITGPATGTMRVLADGIATPILLNTAAIIAKVGDSQIRYGNLAGMKNNARVKYTLVVEVAMAA